MATTQVGIVAPLAWFVIAIAVAHAIRRDVDWRAKGISHYAVGPQGWLAVSGFVTLAFALGMLARTVDRPIAISAATAAIGFLGAAVFPVGPPGLRDRLHRLFATGAFFASAAAGVLAASLAGYTLAITTLAFFVSFRTLPAFAGLFQRAFFLALVAWILGTVTAPQPS